MPGQWKEEVIIEKKHKRALGILVVRTTLLVISVLIKVKTIQKVREAFAEVFSQIDPKMKKTNDLSSWYRNG